MPGTEAPAIPPFRQAYFRWVICGLLFLVTVNNYMDRQIMGVMAPELIKLFKWSPQDYTNVVFWFQIGYALGFLAGGKFFDLVGTRLGFAVAVACWSLAATWHAGVSSIFGFMLVRFLLGFAEPSHMPGGIKVVSEWFPPSERALATGIFKSGSNIGALLVPALVPWMTTLVDWRAVFLITAATGFVWVAIWLWLYQPPEKSPWVSSAERAYLARGIPPVEPVRIPWRVLLRRRETWAYINFKFMTDAIWHWYLAMLPLFLSQRFGLGLMEFGLPLVVIYLIGDAGSVGGGWMSSHWIKRGWDLTRARKLAMLICCVATLPVILVTQVQNLWLVIIVVGIAHAGHQGLTSNLFSTVSDLYPQRAIGSVVGFGGTMGQVGAILMTLLSGVVLTRTGSLTVLFFVAGTAYMVAFFIFHWLVPRLVPLDFNAGPARLADQHG